MFLFIAILFSHENAKARNLFVVCFVFSWLFVFFVFRRYFFTNFCTRFPSRFSPVYTFPFESTATLPTP